MIFVAELMSGRDRHRPPLEPTPLFPFLKVGWFPCRDLRTCWRPKMWAIGPSGYTYSGLSKYKSVANTWVGRFTCPPPLGKLSGNMVLRPSGKGSLGGGSFHQTGVYCLICHRPPLPNPAVFLTLWQYNSLIPGYCGQSLWSLLYDLKLLGEYHRGYLYKVEWISQVWTQISVFSQSVNMKNDPRWVGLVDFYASNLCQPL